MTDFSDSREASEDRLKSTKKTWALAHLDQQVVKFAAMKWYSKDGNKAKSK